MPNKNIALYKEWKIQFEKTFEYLNPISSHSFLKKVQFLSKFISSNLYSPTLILLSIISIHPNQNCSHNQCQIDLIYVHEPTSNLNFNTGKL